MEADVSAEVQRCATELESYDEIEVVSENKDIPRDTKNDKDSGGSSGSGSGSDESVFCERTPSITVLRPSGSDDESFQSVSCSSTPPASPSFKPYEFELPKGPRFKLLTEGDLQVCYLNHTRTVISKILSSKFLRRWESHRIYLNDSCISSKTPMGFLDMSIQYSTLTDVYIVQRFDHSCRFCIRLVVPHGSILLQANNAYIRDQWFHSIQWKRNIFKYQSLLTRSNRPDVILKELKNLVEMARNTPLHDECIYQVPLEIVTRLLTEEDECWSGRSFSEELISSLAPLLENCPPSTEMCVFFSRHCVQHPRSPLVSDALTPIVHRILKHNVDFGKYPLMKKLVQDYIQALYTHNGNEDVILRFVASVHGPSSGCPHPRVLPNLVSVCLSAIFNAFDSTTIMEQRNVDGPDDRVDKIDCYLQVFRIISEYDDWRAGLAQLLQPIPFPDEALANHHFIKNLTPVIRSIGTSTRCDIHQMVLGVRDGKEGWFDVFCPSSLACIDEGQLWGEMLDTLLRCCCKRKRFVCSLVSKRLGPCLLLCLRECVATQTALCLALEWDLLSEPDQRLTVATTLQSTASGSQAYAALCQRQLHLQELHKKGGPRKLTLPSRSTDSDVIRLLSCSGSLGSVECLSLAFTHVTSACAEHIVKLPALRYLNLWATQFGDAGLLIISEHLPKLQVLNLCETPVSDKGIEALTAMTNLRKLNLNSTKLSPQTFEVLKSKLPALQELDVRYTEAW